VSLAGKHGGNGEKKHWKKGGKRNHGSNHHGYHGEKKHRKHHGKHHGKHEQYPKDCACKKATTYSLCKPLIQENKCLFTVSSKGAMCHPPLHHKKTSGDWCYDQAGTSAAKCKLLAAKCQFVDAKCLIAKEPKAPPVASESVLSKPMQSKKSFSEADEAEFDQMEVDEPEHSGQGEEQKDKPIHHRRGKRGKCHLVHILIAVVVYLAGLLTATLHHRFCPRCLCCCFKKPLSVTPTSVVIPASVVHGMVETPGAVVKPEPPLPLK